MFLKLAVVKFTSVLPPGMVSLAELTMGRAWEA
jgi:hypothetical protein